MPGRALGRARPVRPVTALISPVVPFRATSFTIRLARSAPMSISKPTTDCVALHYGGRVALNAEPEWWTTPRCGQHHGLTCTGPGRQVVVSLGWPVWGAGSGRGRGLFPLPNGGR